MTPPFNLSNMHLVRANTQAVIPTDITSVAVSDSSAVVVPTNQTPLLDWVIPGIIVGVVTLLMLGGEL